MYKKTVVYLQLITATRHIENSKNEKKDAQRRRTHCALAVVRRSQKFSPWRRRPSWGRGTAKI